VIAKAPAATANRVRIALSLPTVLEDRTTGNLVAIDPRILAARSYQNGFLKDALTYYQQARETNPVDAEIALKLGWTNNMLHDDASALKWFGIAAAPPIMLSLQKQRSIPQLITYRGTCPYHSVDVSDVLLPLEGSLWLRAGEDGD
jgi:hypothetical protein